MDSSRGTTVGVVFQPTSTYTLTHPFIIAVFICQAWFAAPVCFFIHYSAFSPLKQDLMYLKMISFCATKHDLEFLILLHPIPNAGITDTCYQSLFMPGWGSNPGLQAYWASIYQLIYIPRTRKSICPSHNSFSVMRPLL